MKIECLEGIPCPKYKDACCKGCEDFNTCDFENKCTLDPETCGNEDYETLLKERRA